MTSAETNKEYMTALQNKWYPIYNDNSADFFLDKNNNCYFFASKTHGDHFIEENKINAYTDYMPEEYKFFNLLNELQSMNCKNIIFYYDEEKKIVLTTELTSQIKQHKNASAKNACLMLKETHQKKYIKLLKNETFLCCIKLFERKEKEYPQIHYAYANINDKKYYLLFTSVPEFNKWNETQNNEYVPTKTTIADFTIISKDHGLFIDPMTTKLLLKKGQFQCIVQ